MDYMTEVLLYGDINNYSASDFINNVNAADESEDLVVRINTNGGDPFAAYGMMAKFSEFKGSKKCKVDGKANSSGLFFLTASSSNEALSSSQLVIHRAALPSWIESNEDVFNDELKSQLSDINSHLRGAFESKVDVEAFEKIAKVSMDDIFSLEDRIDVVLNAKQAKKIGLIDTIIPLTASVKKKYEANCSDLGIAAFYNKDSVTAITADEGVKPNNKQIKKMTRVELQATHPELFEEVKNLGVTAEKDRIKAWLVGVDIDAKTVVEGIESDTDPSKEVLANFGMKKYQIEAAAKLEKENAEDVDPLAEPTVEKSPLELLSAKLDSELGLIK